MISEAPQTMFVKVGYSLRYEITFALVLLFFWSMGQLASLRQKRGARAKKLAAHLPTDTELNKSPSPRGAGKGSSQHVAKAGGNRSFKTEMAPAQLGCIDDINPVLLRDPAWLLPQLTRMCRTQVRQSLALYRAALDAGLKLKDVPANDCEELFVALVTAAIRTCHMDETVQILRDLREHGHGVSIGLFSSVAKLCTSKHLFTECLGVHDFMAEDPNFTLVDKSVWSCLLFCAIESRAHDRCNYFFDRIKACGVPSHKDYGNMVRLASLQGDWQLSLNLIKDMAEAAVEIDSVVYNTCLATCVAAGKVDEGQRLLEEMENSPGLADAITYNTLMKCYAKSGQMDQCYKVFERLKSRVAPSQVTYGILLDGFINENRLEDAAQVFNTMVSTGGTMNTVLFTTLIKGFARAGEVDQAMQVYEQMRNERNVTPDLITFSILIKANCDADRLEEALKLLEAMVNLNLRPDEVVFNNLLAGCARMSNVKLGKRLYADMLACGIRPSNATFSILIRFFHQCKILDEAVEMLKNEPAKHKVDPEPRLYLQLIQSCIRERQGHRAVEVYEIMVQLSLPTASMHSSMITTCLKLNMFDTAAEILGIAATRKFRVDSRDAAALLEGAVRKRKTQVASDVAASMTKLGFHIDPKLAASVSTM